MSRLHYKYVKGERDSAREEREELISCRNVNIHSGSISHLRVLVQMRTKESKGQKNKKINSFLLQIYFQLLSLYFDSDHEYRHTVAYFDRRTRLS